MELEEALDRGNGYASARHFSVSLNVTRPVQIPGHPLPQYQAVAVTQGKWKTVITELDAESVEALEEKFKTIPFSARVGHRLDWDAS